MPENVLIVAAHPDDEILGVGGTAAGHANDGDIVHTLILAQGATSRTGSVNAKSMSNVAELRAAAQAAAGIIGAQPPRFLDLPDNRLDSVDLLDLIQLIETEISAIKPSVVYVHHGSDLNVDHQRAHQAVLTACRPLPGQSVRKLYTFETLSSTEWAALGSQPQFRPARFVAIDRTLDKKLLALEAYACEMRPFPHPRSAESVEALARLRGSQVGIPAAEAFGVVFDIQP